MEPGFRGTRNLELRSTVLTLGGDHQLAGQSQRSHGVLVDQSRETTYESKSFFSNSL